MKRTATISECGDYRYALSRVWDDSKPMVMFVMLNPSTADGTIDDPTIRRCLNFAKDWGYGGLYVGNLFAYRSTSPKELLKTDDPHGEFNNYHLSQMADECQLIVCAWGNYPIIKKLNPTKLENIKQPLSCIELSINGTPKHPLYLKGCLKPITFNL